MLTVCQAAWLSAGITCALLQSVQPRVGPQDYNCSYFINCPPPDTHFIELSESD